MWNRLHSMPKIAHIAGHYSKIVWRPPSSLAAILQLCTAARSPPAGFTKAFRPGKSIRATCRWPPRARAAFCAACCTLLWALLCPPTRVGVLAGQHQNPGTPPRAVMAWPLQVVSAQH
jgi:hypothetical protein